MLCTRLGETSSDIVLGPGLGGGKSKLSLLYWTFNIQNMFCLVTCPRGGEGAHQKKHVLGTSNLMYFCPRKCLPIMAPLMGHDSDDGPQPAFWLLREAVIQAPITAGHSQPICSCSCSCTCSCNRSCSCSCSCKLAASGRL